MQETYLQKNSAKKALTLAPKRVKVLQKERVFAMMLLHVYEYSYSYRYYDSGDGSCP
jgi:hypothetical protein